MPTRRSSSSCWSTPVSDTDAVDAEQARLAKSGLTSVDERATTCCYARQDKFWVPDAPDGESWEIYTVLEDSQTFYGEDDGPACCGGSSEESAGAASTAVACC